MCLGHTWPLPQSDMTIHLHMYDVLCMLATYMENIIISWQIQFSRKQFHLMGC